MQKHIKALTVLALIIALLAGCKHEEAPTGSIESWEKLDVTYNGSTTAEIFLTGLDGKAIKAEEITVDNVKMCCGIQGDSGKVTANLLNVKRL